jgi:hypothetical protein
LSESDLKIDIELMEDYIFQDLETDIVDYLNLKNNDYKDITQLDEVEESFLSDIRELQADSYEHYETTITKSNNEKIELEKVRKNMSNKLDGFEDEEELTTYKVSRFDTVEDIAVLHLIKEGVEEPNQALIEQAAGAITDLNKVTDTNTLEIGLELKLPTIETIKKFVVEEVKPDSNEITSPIESTSKKSLKRKIQ